MRSIALLTVLLMVLAGCSGDSGKKGTSGDDIDLDEDDVDLGGLGAFEGRIHDVGNRSIRDVFVHVLADEQLQDKTDRDGKFSITGITPGQYKVHIFHESYVAKTFDITVQADKVLRTNIELKLLKELCAACSPHAHDHWGGDTRVTIMDSQNDMRQRTGDSTVIPVLVTTYGTIVHPNANNSAPIIGNLYPLHFTGGDESRPPIILPGTGAYELTLSWDETEIQTDTLGLRVWPMGNDSHEYWIHPVKNGETVTRNVPVDMSDNGHQTWTFWRFWYYIPNDATHAPDYSPMVNLGAVRAQMDVIKSEQPYLEPGHPDFWGNKTEYVFADDSWTRSLSLSHPSGAGMPRVHEEGDLVWPGADRMTIEFTWKEGPNRENLGTHILRWRTGEQNPATTSVMEFKTAPGDSCGDQCILYSLDLLDEETDQYYYKDSNWRFYAYPEYGEEQGAYQDSDLEYRVKVTVYKDG